MKNYLHPHYIQLILIKLYEYYWYVINIIYAKYWTIDIPFKQKFRGLVMWNKLPHSKITIGNNCTFLSTETSNLIGINTPCIISTLKSGAIIEIGDNSGFSGTVIGCAKYIKIGNNVRCGANTLITDSDWHLDDTRSGKPAEVIIEDNVWLGVNSTVLKGVTIGSNSVIGANSVVTKSIPANVIAAGNPCKIIKQL